MGKSALVYLSTWSITWSITWFGLKERGEKRREIDPKTLYDIGFLY